MICAYDSEAKAWVAAGNGRMRPIIAEGDCRQDAVKAYRAIFDHQLGEEYAYCESMTHHSEAAKGNAYGEDLG